MPSLQDSKNQATTDAFHQSSLPVKYYIAYTLEDEEKNRVDQLRYTLAEKFGVHAALCSPPHVTIHPPFETDRIHETKEQLRTICQTRSPFPIEVTQFSTFPFGNVFFLDVKDSLELLEIRTTVMNHLAMKIKSRMPLLNRKPHFHITLATKDVSDTTMQQILDWAKDQPLPITNITIDHLSLLRWVDQHWVIDEEFPFGYAK